MMDKFSKQVMGNSTGRLCLQGVYEVKKEEQGTRKARRHYERRYRQADPSLIRSLINKSREENAQSLPSFCTISLITPFPPSQSIPPPSMADLTAPSPSSTHSDPASCLSVPTTLHYQDSARMHPYFSPAASLPPPPQDCAGHSPYPPAAAS